MKTYFSQQIKKHRSRLSISQEELASRLGISTQAVSKWECTLSYPDIELLPKLADIFQTTIDELFREQTVSRIVPYALPQEFPMEQDNVLRIIQVRNGDVLTTETYDPNTSIPLILPKTDSEFHIEVWGSAHIDGNLGGSLNAGQCVECGDVTGQVNAGQRVECGDVTGQLNAGQSVSCGNVNGNVNAGMSINCDNIGGNVSAGMSISCDSVDGNVSAGQNVVCDDIGGDVSGTNITCDSINGDTITIICENELTYDTIYGDVILKRSSDV